MFWRLFYNKDSNDLYIFNIKIVGRQGFDGDLDVDDDDLDVDGPEFDQKFEEGYNFQKEYESLEEEGFHLADWGTIVMCTAIEKGISIDCEKEDIYENVSVISARLGSIPVWVCGAEEGLRCVISDWRLATMILLRDSVKLMATGRLYQRKMHKKIQKRKMRIKIHRASEMQTLE